MNAVGGILFALDKRSAVKGRRRVSERTLLVLALLGAAPAMLWLSARIRHKTEKQPFRNLLMGAAVVNALCLIAVGLFGLGIIP